MVVLRLARAGKTKSPYYHVVATDSRNPRDGKFLETIGTWDPRAGEGKFDLDQVRYEAWVKKGARPSELVAKLVTRSKSAAAAPAKA
jgi:small subunit ribosomal protein S16